MRSQQSPLSSSFLAFRQPQQRQIAGICLALAAITFAVFGQTLWHGFINYDDNDYVYDNPVVTQGLTFKGIGWAFAGSHAANWHPLTWLSHMLDCQVYGLHPGGHHFTSVLLHAATVIAFFLVLRQMTSALWRSAFAAALFAIHPLRVESVAWVAERKDVLSGFFFILAIGSYVRFARHPWSLARYGLVVLLFGMGLMCKPMLVTLPMVLLLLDYWPLQRVTAQKFPILVIEKLPLLGLSAISCLVTLLAQRGAIQSTQIYSLPLRFGNALVTGIGYLGQWIYPAGLALFYPYPLEGPPAWKVGLAVFVLTGFCAAAWRWRRSQPWLLVGWVWYLIMLLPVVGIIQVGGQAHADRYTYLPQIGIAVAGTWLMAEWGAKLHLSRTGIGGLMVVVLGALIICARNQTAYWRTSETLWTHTIQCTIDNDVACYNLGDALDQKGWTDEAIIQYQRALEIKTDNIAARINLAADFIQAGRIDEAIAACEKGLQIAPKNADFHNTLGDALRQKGDVDEAIVHFQKALQLRPDFAAAHNDLGSALRQKGRVNEAVAHFQQALQIKPDYAEAHFNLGNALFQTGSLDQAIVHYRQAVQIKPGFAMGHGNLGKALMQTGSTAEAIPHLQKALELNPADSAVQNTLAWVLATCPQESLRDGRQALDLARQANASTGGNNPVILRTLAAALAETGRFSEAAEMAQRALDLAGTSVNTVFAAQVQAQLKLYQAGRPFHGLAPAK